MDLDKVKRNISKMGAQGASEQEIDVYISGEGVTAEQLRAHKNQPQQEKGMLEGALDTAGNVAHTVGEYSGLNAVGKFAKDAYVGKQDPRYSKLGGFTGEGLGYNAYSKTEEGKNQKAIMSPVSPIEQQIAVGKGSTLSDKGYGNTIKSSLGDKYLGSEYDQHGQEIITYKGYDGETHKTYVNKPGLDFEDVSRFAHQAVPFVGTGGAVGAGVKGLGLFGRSTAQGLTALVTDSIVQHAGQEVGNKEDYSYGRNGMALAGGVGGEMLGTALNALFRNPGLIDKATGKLTEKGKEWARANKLDPDAISDDVAKYINQNADKVVDPDELARVARTSEFNIPTTKAQRTKLYDDAYTELQIEKGQRTSSAEKIYKNFREEQKEAVSKATLEDIGDKIAPKAAGIERAEQGDHVRGGLNDILDRSKAQEEKLWSEIGPMFPKEEAFKSLPDIIDAKVQRAGLSPIEGLTNASNEMIKDMKRFMVGDIKTESMGVLAKRANDNIVAQKGSLSDFLLNTNKKDNIPAVNLFEDYNAHRLANGLPENSIEEISQEILKAGLKPKKMAGRIRYDLSGMKSTNNTLGLTDVAGSRQISIDEVRKRLLSKKDTAQAGTPDARLANQLYAGFNDWIDDAAEKALIQADDPAAHIALKSARAFTREQRSLFYPRDKRGRLTPAAKKISSILDGADSPEGVISSIFGRGSGINELPNGTVGTLRHLKKILVPSDRSKAFDSVKLAYWGRLALDKQGNVLSPRLLHKNISTAFKTHKTAMDVMFSKEEQGLMRRFGMALNDLHVEHPNPSLSSIGVAHATRKAAKGFLNATQQRERLVKGNIFKANILSFISKYIDAPLINNGGILARQYTKQGLRTQSKNRIKTIGGVGAFGSVQGYSGE